MCIVKTADINDQFTVTAKVLVSHQSIQQGFMTLGKIWSQEKSVRLLALMVLLGITIPNCSALFCKAR